MTNTQQIEVHEIAYHRNGVAGVGFYAVTFTDHDVDGEPVKFVATVFPPDPITDGPDEGEPDWGETQGFHNPRIAILALDLLPSVTFAHNSWRGDRYCGALYAAILVDRAR